MKKLFSLLAAAGILAAANVQAVELDLTSAAQKAQSKIDETTKKIEDGKAAREAKKAERAKKVEEAKAAREAKKAEQKKALDDAKNSLGNLKNTFAK